MFFRAKIRINTHIANSLNFLLRSCGSEDDFYLNWAVEKAGSRLGPPPLRRQASHLGDRSSVSSGESAAHSTYDHPKTVLKVRPRDQ